MKTFFPGLFLSVKQRQATSLQQRPRRAIKLHAYGNANTFIVFHETHPANQTQAYVGGGGRVHDAFRSFSQHERAESGKSVPNRWSAADQSHFLPFLHKVLQNSAHAGTDTNSHPAKTWTIMSDCRLNVGTFTHGQVSNNKCQADLLVSVKGLYLSAE